MIRHYAFFSQATGEWVREWKGEVPEPLAWTRRLPRALRQLANDRWATKVSKPRRGEVGLDVSQFDYPVGDFCWMVFRPFDGEDGKPLLDWPRSHLFVEIDRRTGHLHTVVESPRPVRSNADTYVVDITGTEWERLHRSGVALAGQFQKDERGAVAFVPIHKTQRNVMALPMPDDTLVPPVVQEPVREHVFAA